MKRTKFLPAAILLAGVVCDGACAAESAPPAGPFARIAFLRPHDGDTVDFEAGYVRHLEWHRRNADPFTWHGWNVWAGERQRWFVYATFGHTADSLANPVNPAADEVDNILNVTPHAEFTGSGVYEFLPALSRGSGVPSALPRAELLTVELEPGTEARFEQALAAERNALGGEMLWFRMLAGGTAPRYLRLRPRQGLAPIIAERGESALPEAATACIARVTAEILALRPTMSYNLPPEAPVR